MLYEVITIGELVAKEDRDDGGRGFVGAEAMFVARIGNACSTTVALARRGVRRVQHGVRPLACGLGALVVPDVV